MQRSFVPSTLSLICYFISIQEFLPPLCCHCIFNYLVNCILQFFHFFWIEPLAKVKNCLGAFSLNLSEVLKQIQCYEVCALCTPFVGGLKASSMVVNNGVAFIIPCLHEVDFKFFEEKGQLLFHVQQFPQIQVHISVRFMVKKAPMSKKSHRLLKGYLWN